MKTKPKQIWRSKIFEDMIFTDQMLAVYKTAYPFIKMFQPELLKAEAWLISNPDRVPEKRWGTFINNWMRIANEIAQREKQNYKLEFRYDGLQSVDKHRRGGANKIDALSLGDILNKAKGYNDKKSQETNNTTEQIPNTGNEAGVGGSN